eukprot:300571-Chlamydomonas_euryale.AAC.2
MGHASANCALASPNATLSGLFCVDACRCGSARHVDATCLQMVVPSCCKCCATSLFMLMPPLCACWCRLAANVGAILLHMSVPPRIAFSCHLLAHLSPAAGGCDREKLRSLATLTALAVPLPPPSLASYTGRLSTSPDGAP